MTTLLSIALGLLVQSTVLLLLGLVTMQLARRHGPAVQSLIGRATLAGVALALLLAMPLAGHIRPVWKVRVGDRPPAPNSGGAGFGRVGALLAAPSAPTSAPTPPELGAGGRSFSFSPVPTFSAPTPLPTERITPAPRPSLLYTTLANTWAAGTTLLLLWLVTSQCHLTRLRRQASPVTTSPTAETLAALTTRPLALLAHPSVRSPFLAGIRRPAIFLPTAYETEFDPTALRAILAHELAHLARRDNAWTLAARLLTALLWPQPLLWVLCRRLEQSGEEACDLAVLAQDCPPRAYAACLLTLAERHPLGRRERALGVGVAPFHSSLGRRIGRILDKGTHAMSAVTLRLRLAVAALAVAAAVGGVFLVSSAPAQSPAPATVTPTPAQQRFNAMRLQDAMNLKTISVALTQCVQDHDEYLPDAAHWMDALSPYLKDKSVFFDPFQPGAKRYGYAFNRNCSRKPLRSVGYPDEVVFVFDSTLGAHNASDTGQSLRYSASQPHRLSNVLFVDGHVKAISADAPPSFTIQPWRGPVHHPRRAGQPSLVGTWLCSHDDGTGNVLIFSRDGQFEDIGPWPGESREIGHSYGRNQAISHSYGPYVIEGAKLRYTDTRLWVEGEKPLKGAPYVHSMDYSVSGAVLTLRLKGKWVNVYRRVPTYTKAMIGISPTPSPEVAAQSQELSSARFLAGLTPVQGPGVVVTLNDSKQRLPKNMPSGMTPPNLIHDSDINQVVNELKAAGAEAIAVNGQRLVATSSARTAGPIILINFVPTAPPYVIRAIGDPKALASAMSLPGGIATQIKAYDFTMFSVKEAEAMFLPAYSGGSEPRYAKPVSAASLDATRRVMSEELLSRMLIQKRGQLEAELLALNTQDAALTAYIREMQLRVLQAAKKSPAPGASSRDIMHMERQALATQLAAARAHLSHEEASGMTSRHPDVVAARRRIQALEAEYRQLPVREKQEFVEEVHQYALHQVAATAALVNAEAPATHQLSTVQGQQHQLQAAISFLDAQIAQHKAPASGR